MSPSMGVVVGLLMLTFIHPLCRPSEQRFLHTASRSEFTFKSAVENSCDTATGLEYPANILKSLEIDLCKHTIICLPCLDCWVLLLKGCLQSTLEVDLGM